MNVKKIANIIFCFAVLLGIDSLQGEQLNTFPPSASINKQISRVVCEQNKITDRVEKPIIPSVFDLQTYNFLDTSYTFEYLNTLSYEELIELIVTLDWWEIEGLF